MIDMACRRALELILDAEPAELSLAGDTPLVAHLNACGRCRAVAKRLASQSQAIARKVEMEPALLAGIPVRAEPEVVRRRVVASVGLAAAAVIAVLAMRQESFEEGRAQTGELSRIAGTDSGAAVREVQPAAPKEVRVRARRPVVPTHGEPLRAVATTAERFETPTVAQTVAQAATDARSRNADLSGVISVAPPVGVRATVLATSNPAVTVIWLQGADSTRNPR